MKRLNMLLLTGVLLVGAAAAGTSTGTAAEIKQEPESKDTIKLAMNEWTGQHITTKIAGEVLKKMGYNVEYVTAGYIPQVQGIMDGDITATLEVWEHTIEGNYDKAVDSKKAVGLGDTGITTKEGWIYPSYVKEQCPELPDWKALKNPDCAKLFATADTYPKARLIDYPTDWAPDNVERIKALGLDIVAKPSGSEGSSVAELKSAITRKKPVLIMFYSPHWIFAKYDIDWVELPKSEPACYDDPKWGPNPDATHDCGWPQGWVRKLGWAGTEKKWPRAYRFLEAYKIDNKLQEDLLLKIDFEGEDLDKAVAEWMDANPDVWKAWVAKADAS
ncbi:ABC transporter substrate-binding protein [Methyloligella sp. GL2]|uniref:ABC transporter substrate-binding protein n=1 Tax=Methyloligella sp. GL2 TaxID=2742204 RepID=UPI00157CDD32|nr:ABC transporter substrate-binding protein [Methyloligella sp. GL2]QKP76956.1 ABC transporter substrate-binding protein [Methyloligella sp. GL2]